METNVWKVQVESNLEDGEVKVWKTLWRWKIEVRKSHEDGKQDSVPKTTSRYRFLIPRTVDSFTVYPSLSL